MKKLPLWKLGREVARLGRQVVCAPGQAWEYATLRRRYDRQAARLRRMHLGDRPLGREAAIYLIFPAEGLLGSHLSMLRTLVAQGIGPVLVSNLPLSEDRLAALRPLCARIIERPNVGYDFGGYRDGILALAEDLPGLDRLYILNDSVWMVDAPHTWFEEVRASDVDFCGATSNFGVPRIQEKTIRTLCWTHSATHPDFHYGSYALALGKAVLADPGFVAFWRGFPLSDEKKRTVRRGEIGLTQWVLKGGYSHAATCPDAGLDAEIAALGDAELDAVARSLIILQRPRLSAWRDEVLQSDPATAEGRLGRIRVILATASVQAIGYALPYYTLRHRGFQFIKKSPLWLSPDGARTTLRILAALQGPLGREAAAEAEALAAARDRDAEARRQAARKTG